MANRQRRCKPICFTQQNLKESLLKSGSWRASRAEDFAVAMTDAQPAPAKRSSLLTGRLRAIMGGSSEASLTKRLAGTIFIIRVISAGLAYVAQILLARWMGGSDYGVYVYVWTWVLLLGSMMDFGISASAQKIIPEYRASGDDARLRGFLSGSRWMTFIVASLISISLAALVRVLSPWIDAATVVPLYVGCLTLPAFVVANTQDGIARSHDWMRLGLMPQFIVRQSLIIGFTAGAFALGFHLSATVAMLASVAAVWTAMIGQLIVLNRGSARHRVRAEVPRFSRLALGLVADFAGRELLSPVVLHRCTRAAAVSLVGGGRRIFRRR